MNRHKVVLRLPRRLPIIAAAVLAASCRQDVNEPAALRFVVVHAGNSHSCGIGEDATLYCWGSDAGGLLGDGLPLEGSYRPRRVAGSVRFSAVAAGRQLTCAAAVDGAPYCWGNPVGEPGDFVSNNFLPEPTVVPGTSRFVVIDARETVACGIAAGGALYCWGSNGVGQLGTGAAEPECLSTDGIPNPCHPEPQAAAGGIRFTTVSSGEDYACGISVDSAGYCWGHGAFGKLGDGSVEDRASPTAVAGGLRLIGISTGSGHACAVAADGVAYCWGYNFSGQLGIGTGDTLIHSSPVRVESGSVRFRSIDAGGSHTCAIATDGTAYCWGWGPVGQLGTGFHQDAHRPEPVATSLRFSSVSAGVVHTCAVSTEGDVYCWGRNEDGQIGSNPDQVGQSGIPVRVLTP